MVKFKLFAQLPVDRLPHFIIIIIIAVLRVFPTSVSWWFHTWMWVTASILKSPWSPISIQADVNNVVVWMVYFHPLITKSSNAFINPLLTVQSTPTRIAITVTFTFHRFFDSLARSMYLTFFSFSFNFTQWSARTEKSTIQEGFFFNFLLTITRYGRMAKIRWSLYISKSQRSLSVSFSIICSYGQISISCTIPSKSPSPPSHVTSYTFLVLFAEFAYYYYLYMFVLNVFQLSQPFSCGWIAGCLMNIFIVLVRSSWL